MKFRPVIGVSFHSMESGGKCALPVAGNAIAEGQKGIHKVDILKENVGDVRGQFYVGKIPKAVDTEGDQLICQRLRDALRNGQHRYLGMIRRNITLQVVHGTDLYTADMRVDQLGGDIKSGIDLKTDFLEIKVLHQGVTEVTRADNDQAVTDVDAENVTDLTAQFGNIIAVALLTEFTEAAQVLTDLRGGDPHLRAERIGGDANRAAIVKVIQIAVIAGQTVDDRIGNLLLFHRAYIILFPEIERAKCTRKMLIGGIVPHFLQLVNFFNNLFAIFLRSLLFTRQRVIAIIYGLMFFLREFR